MPDWRSSPTYSGVKAFFEPTVVCGRRNLRRVNRRALLRFPVLVLSPAELPAVGVKASLTTWRRN